MKRGGAHDYAAVIATPLPGGWRLGLRVEGGALSAIDLLSPDVPLVVPTQSQAVVAAEALAGYFRLPHRCRFEVPPAATGTPFQRRVWAALQQIPPGEVVTYGALAAQLGSSARAVAGACRANPLPLLVPCHRVVAVHGAGGFMGESSGEFVKLKQWLLHHEGA